MYHIQHVQFVFFDEALYLWCIHSFYYYYYFFFIIIIIIIFIIIIIIFIIIIIISSSTLFAGFPFVHQLGTNHAPRVSVTQVSHSVHTLSTFLRICTIPRMQIF